MAQGPCGVCGNGGLGLPELAAGQMRTAWGECVHVHVHMCVYVHVCVPVHKGACPCPVRTPETAFVVSEPLQPG